MSGRCHLVRELCFAHHHLQKYRLKDLQIELKQHHSVSSPISTVVFLVWVWDCFPVYPEELCLGDKLHGRIKCLSITQLADIKFNATLSIYMLTAEPALSVAITTKLQVCKQGRFSSNSFLRQFLPFMLHDWRYVSSFVPIYGLPAAKSPELIQSINRN